MINRIITCLKNYDWILFFSVILLLLIGLAEIYSIALSKNSLDLDFFKKQLLFVVIGILGLFVLSFFDYHNLRSFGNYFYLLGAILLIGVFFFGKTVRGTTGWYDFGGLSMQPVEFVKFLLIISLARYFSNNSVRVNPLKHLVISGTGSFVLIFLVLKQPDFGSALLLFSIWGSLVIFAGFKMRYILFLVLIVFMTFLSGWMFFFQDYQKQRIMTFLRPVQNDTLGEGYNITQAIIAVGSGGIFGRGIGFGSQSQLKFLPEAQNDFIFAAIAEELGFFGVCLLLSFFGTFFYRLIRAVKIAKNDFGIYFILGVLSLILIEMFVNIGMNIGLLPVVGISLPFVSYGGSAIVSTLMMVGVIESIIVQSNLKY